MNGRNKIERAKSKNKVSKVSKIQKNRKNEKQEIILKPMKYIKITTYEDCFQIMNPIQKTVQRLSKLPFKPKSQEGFLHSSIYHPRVEIHDKITIKKISRKKWSGTSRTHAFSVLRIFEWFQGVTRFRAQLPSRGEKKRQGTSNSIFL